MAQIELKFDTYDFTTKEEIETLEHSGEVRLTPITVPGRHGTIISTATPAREPVMVSVTGRIIGTDADNARDLADNLKEVLYNGDKHLKFFNDRYRNAYLQGYNEIYAVGTAMTVIMFNTSFYCYDPFEYSTSESVHAEDLANAGTLILPNRGNAIIYPLWTVRTVGGAISAITVTNQSLSPERNFTFSAQVANGQSLIVNAGDYLVTNAGASAYNYWGGDFVWMVKGNNTIKLEYTTDSGSPVVNLNATYREKWQ